MKSLPTLEMRMSILLLIATSALSVPVSLAEESCRVALPPEMCIEGQDCFEKLECRHGRCDLQAGCVCDTCWTGKSCQRYVDEFGPTFDVRDAYHEVDSSYDGLHYQLHATDSDLGSTCPLGMSGPPARCPCAVIGYRITWANVSDDVISLDTDTGLVTVMDLEKLTPGMYYRLQIEAHAEPPVDAWVDWPVRDVMNLTLFRAVDVSAELEQALLEADNLQKEAEQEMGEIGAPQTTELEPHGRRAKRDAPGTTADSTTLTLTRTDGGGTTPSVGEEMTYSFVISLPQMSMDMKVEIFVADLDNGQTAFHIHNAAITSVGGGLSSSAGTVTDLLFEDFHNKFLPQYVDRKVLDLGTVTNSAGTTSGVAGDSDITIEFKVVVIQNTEGSISGTTQYVSAGAEYDQANYVWVANDQFTPTTTSAAFTSAEGTVALASATGSAAQYGTAIAELQIPVAAAAGETYVEAFLVHQGVTDESMSIGGPYVKMGAQYLMPEHPVDVITGFNGDDFGNKRVHTAGGRATFKSFSVPYLQIGGAAASSADAGRLMTVKIPVYANGDAAVGGKATLVIFTRTKDLISGSDINTAGTSVNFEITVTAGTAPSASGSLGSLTKSATPLDSASLDVITSSTVSYLVETEVPDGAFIETTDITLNTGASGLRSCAVELFSQGGDVLNVELGAVTITPLETGDTSTSLNLKNIHAGTGSPVSGEALTTGYKLVFRVSVRAEESAAPTVDPGALGLDAVNVTGDLPSASQPTITLAVASGATTVNIGQMFGLDMTLVYPDGGIHSDSTADYNVEFASDLRLDYEVQMCSVQVVSVGRDLPCAAAKLAAGPPTPTFSTTNDTKIYNDVVSVSLPLTCAQTRAGQEDADRTLKVRALAQIMPGQTLTDTDFKPGAGVELSPTTLFAGLVSLTMAAPLTTLSAGTLTFSAPAGPLPLTFGKVHAVEFSLYIPPGSASPAVTVRATSSDPTRVRVDRVVIRRIGKSMACLDDELVNADQNYVVEAPLTPTSYPAFTVESPAPEGVLGEFCELLLGPITNVGGASDSPTQNTAETTLRFVGSDHLVLAALVQALPNADGSAPADVSDVTLTVSGQADASTAITDASVPFTFSGLDTRYTAADAPAPTMTVQARDDTTIVIGVPKVVEVVVDLPDDAFYGTLKLSCEGPAGAEYEVSGAAVISYGDHVSGVWPTVTKPVVTSADVAGMTLGQSAVLTIADITVVKTTQTAYANSTQLTAACVYNVPTASSLADGASVTASVVLLDGADSQVTTGSASLTLSTTYTPTPSEINVTQLIVLNTTVPTGNIGDYLWVPFQLVVPPGTHMAELAVVSDTLENRAFFTFHDFRFGTNIGADVLGLPQLNEDSFNFTITNTNITHPSQKDTLLVDLGVLTNLGLSQELPRGKGGQTEWLFEVEVYTRITGHPTLFTAGTQKIYLSFALGGSKIEVVEQEITAVEVAEDKILVDTTIALVDDSKILYDQEVDQNVALSVTLAHNNDSRREAEDMRAVVIFPPYMTYENDTATFNSSSLTVLYKGSSVALVVGAMWFDDIYTINFTALIDPTFIRGRGSGPANATTIGRAICKPTLDTAAYDRCGPMSFVMYEVVNPECSDPLLATLTDCHFAASASVSNTGAYTAAGLKTDSGWRPPVRDDPAWTRQHAEVRFFVPTRVSGYMLTNIGARPVTRIALHASNDGITFLEKFTGAVTSGVKTDLLADSFNARYVRVVILEAGPDAAQYIQIKVELYGCQTDQNLPVEDVCPTVEDNAIYTDAPSRWRHFAVDTTNNIIYYCDYDLAREQMLCFASADDGLVWIAQPKYLGELRGHSAGKMYAYDSKLASTLASEDGQNWQMVPEADVPVSLDPVSAVPGSTEVDFTAPVTQSGWEGDYTGLKKTGGSYVVKWGKCCSA